MLENEEDIIANTDLFAQWYSATSRSNNNGYKSHAIDVLEYWLDAKIPGREIGNLFRFDQVEEFDIEKARIVAIPEYAGVNSADQRGRTNAALGKFRKFLLALEAGTVEDDIENQNVAPRTRHNSAGNDRVINCIEGLIELIVGSENADLPQNEKLKMLARHMVQKSYFFTRETVRNRHQEILALIDSGAKLPARYSSATAAYTEADGTVVHFAKNTVAFDASSQRDIMYNSFGRQLPVVIDRDGNREVRNNIERYSGARVSQGRVRSNMTSAIISHIWGNAFDPLCFTNFWNIVVVPDYINSILDKSESEHPANFFEEAVNYVKGYYKELCYKLYDMGSMIDDYEARGFNIRPLFAAAATSNLEDTIDKMELNFLENQGF